jgi:hypothetical protein
LTANNNFNLTRFEKFSYQHFLFLAFLLLCCDGERVPIFINHLNIQTMTSHPVQRHHHHIERKAIELGISSDIISCALNIISQNKNLVNAMDNGAEMDDYIYQTILKQAFNRRMVDAEKNFYSDDESRQIAAEKDLKILEREELTSDAFYRAVLPLMVKTLQHEPIRRLHAEEASSIVMKLADCKRRFRATSLTEVIVKTCSVEIEAFQTA